MDYNIEMASNKQPYIMCPACFKGAVVVDYVANEGKCNHCSEEFTVNGLRLTFKSYQGPCG